jgi:hypothetical protein
MPLVCEELSVCATASSKFDEPVVHEIFRSGCTPDGARAPAHAARLAGVTAGGDHRRRVGGLALDLLPLMAAATHAAWDGPATMVRQFQLDHS